MNFWKKSAKDKNASILSDIVYGELYVNDLFSGTSFHPDRMIGEILDNSSIVALKCDNNRDPDHLESMIIMNRVNKVHIILHPNHHMSSLKYYTLIYGESCHLPSFFDNFLQPSTTEISRLITVKENIVSGSMWRILFRHLFDSNFYNVFSYSYDDYLSGKSTYDVEHLCGSNFYNVFSYSYDDYLSGKSTYDVENRFKNAHLYYHNFYDVFTYSYDDQKTYHHS